MSAWTSSTNLLMDTDHKIIHVAFANSLLLRLQDRNITSSLRAGMHFKYFKILTIGTLHKALYITGNQLLFKEREGKIGNNIKGV